VRGFTIFHHKYDDFSFPLQKLSETSSIYFYVWLLHFFVVCVLDKVIAIVFVVPYSPFLVKLLGFLCSIPGDETI
jgi:hypothetical protein